MYSLSHMQRSSAAISRRMAFGRMNSIMRVSTDLCALRKGEVRLFGAHVLMRESERFPL
jgi:hypothetical protein